MNEPCLQRPRCTEFVDLVAEVERLQSETSSRSRTIAYYQKVVADQQTEIDRLRAAKTRPVRR